MHYLEITSKDNNKLKQLTKLASSRVYRYEQKLAAIYGEHLIQEAIKHKILNNVFINKNLIPKYKHLLAACNPKQVYVLESSLLNKCRLSDSTIDLAATIILPEANLDNTVYLEDCIILEKVQDPGNLGTIMRVAIASGIKNLILSEGCADPYNIKVLRASQGLQFGLKIINDVDIVEVIAQLKLQVLATTIDANKTIYKCNLSKPTAWIFGNEGTGLSASLLNTIQCDKVSIPMLGNAESLNVAMAATVCLFEAMRQRM